MRFGRRAAGVRLTTAGDDSAGEARPNQRSAGRFERERDVVNRTSERGEE
jgi:hypothetical protein